MRDQILVPFEGRHLSLRTRLRFDEDGTVEQVVSGSELNGMQDVAVRAALDPTASTRVAPMPVTA